MEEIQETAPLVPEHKEQTPKGAIEGFRKAKKKRKRTAMVRKLKDGTVKQYTHLDKMNRFMDEFVKNNGNATEAYARISKEKNRTVCATMGGRYLKQARQMGLVRVLLEKKGYSYGKFLDVAIDKMSQSKTPEWFDRLLKMADHDNFIDKEKGSPGNVVNIIQTEKEILKKYTDGEEIEVVDLLPEEGEKK